MARRLVLAALGVWLGLAAVPVPASALSSSESKFVSLINQERKERDVSVLVAKGDLSAIARKHSARMAADNTIYHNSNLSNEVQGSWSALGENVGMGPTVETLHEAFMDSPGHRANILDRDYNQIGLGVVVKDETIYVTEVFAGRSNGKKVITKTVPKPAAQPKKIEKRPVVRVAAPRTMGMLLRLAGLDARRVNPANGQALGL